MELACPHAGGVLQEAFMKNTNNKKGESKDEKINYNGIQYACCSIRNERKWRNREFIK